LLPINVQGAASPTLYTTGDTKLA